VTCASSIIESKELVQELKDSDESEMSDIHESSESDFHNKKDAMLLPDSGDDNDGDECVHVNDTNFVWEDMDNYSGLREVFIGMCGPQNSVQSVTDVVDRSLMELSPS
jgi:hypothetical protein